MGYTIYYKTRKNKYLTKEEVAECVSAIRQIIQKHSKIVHIEFKGKAEDNKWNINFNGYEDDGHETFCFYSYYNENPAEMVLEALDSQREFNGDYISLNGELRGAFCKTARKQYDYVVKLCLIKVQEITDNAFEITCDDNLEYTKEGVRDKLHNNCLIFPLKKFGDKYDWGKENA